MIYLALKLATFMAVLATPTFHPPREDYNVNLREACRRAIAGAYLKAYDEREINRDSVRNLTKSLAASRKELKELQRQKATLQKQNANREFDVELTSRINQLTSATEALNAQIKDHETLLSKAKERVEATEAIEHRLRESISKIFKIERTEDQPDGGYPVTMTYRSSCPKYRHLCPLPPADAAKLLKIHMEGGRAPESCRRYASLSKIKAP